MPRKPKPPTAPLVTERRNLTQPPDWWQAFEIAARAAGQTLSEWIGATCRAALPAARKEPLSSRVGRGKPAKTDAVAPGK